MNHPIAAAFSLMLLGAAPGTPTRSGTVSVDTVAVAWNARAELASKRLAGTGLDACDRAVEAAFQSVGVKTKGRKRMFALRIELEGKDMMVTWGYDGQKLADFGIVTLPPQWFIRQVAGQKTLTVLSSEFECAFDLCPDAPIAGSRCSGE